MTSAKIFQEHEVSDYPCACWLAGNGVIRGLNRNQVQHPEEFSEGAMCASEEALDI